MTATVIRLDDYRAPTRREPGHLRVKGLPKPPRELGPLTVAEAIEICLCHPEVLSAWEENFLASIRRIPRLSIKQHQVLIRIFDKVCGAAAGWAT